MHNRISELILEPRVEGESTSASQRCLTFKSMWDPVLRQSPWAWPLHCSRQAFQTPTERQVCASVLSRVLGWASVQVDFEGLFLARRVADAVSGLQQPAALLLHQLVALVLWQIHRLLSAVPVHTHITEKLTDIAVEWEWAAAVQCACNWEKSTVWNSHMVWHQLYHQHHGRRLIHSCH